MRLNANESPGARRGTAPGPASTGIPEPRPSRLTASLAAHYGVAPDQVLVTRGSSEAIDVLIRGFCRAGIDEVVICPPTFGMYEVYAQMQGAAIRRVPLLRERGYALDVAGILRDWSGHSRLVFVCSPNNPTGNSFPVAAIRELAASLRDRGAVVLDAAYAEFARSNPCGELLAEFDNVIVLRTLSKAMGLAGVRCGALHRPARGSRACWAVCCRPTRLPRSCAEAVQRCLEPAHAAEWQRRISLLKSERERLFAELARCPRIRRVWPSDANFLLVEAQRPART